ncbi:MAG TPA: glycosyltransferase family 4 protein [Acidimicrobiales bacterium]|nr:glycosyltransferase family 4 protein [Acidimicrobiales bacterium]
MADGRTRNSAPGPEGGSVLALLGPSTGGIRRHVVELATRLRQRGWSVEIAGPHGVLEEPEVLDHCVDVPSPLGPARLVAARRALTSAAAGAQLIHAHGLKAGWLAASLRSRSPLVVTLHNVVLPEVAGAAAPVLHRLELALPARCDATVAVSNEMARRLVGVPGGGRVTVVAPVAPTPRVRVPAGQARASVGARPGQPLVVSVGRLHPQKGHDTLIDAAGILARRRPEVRVVIVGDGPSHDSLARRVQRLGLEEVVALVGSRPSGADTLAAADVVALASRWEGWPLVVAEAIQLGRPVVATAVGGIPEMVEDGVSGWLVPPGSPDALALSLEAALADPGLAMGRAEAARTRFNERYDADNLVERVESVYRDVLERA